MRLFWGLLGSFGLCCGIFSIDLPGPFGIFWDLSELWGFSWDLPGPSGTFCAFLGASGIFQDLLGSFGIFQDLSGGFLLSPLHPTALPHRNQTP